MMLHIEKNKMYESLRKSKCNVTSGIQEYKNQRKMITKIYIDQDHDHGPKDKLKPIIIGEISTKWKRWG